MTAFLDTSTPKIGLGCWAIGGPFTAGGRAVGWGVVDDAQSTRAIHAAVDMGVRLFDSAQAYGAGHSETVLGHALKNRPDVALVTKFGWTIDTQAKTLDDMITDPATIRATLDASRTRFQREHIDLVLMHPNDMDIALAAPIFDELDKMQAEGAIGGYGWSTDFPDRLNAFTDRPAFTATEHAMNVFFRAEHMVTAIEATQITGLVRSPLAMGILGGKYGAGAQFKSDDVRGTDEGWMAYFKDGKIKDKHLQQLDGVRDILSSNGRSLAQGALAWLWARSPNALPIPGFRTTAQVTDLCGAMDHGPLTQSQMADIEAILDRPPEGPPMAR